MATFMRVLLKHVKLRALVSENNVLLWDFFSLNKSNEASKYPSTSVFVDTWHFIIAWDLKKKKTF